MSKILYLIGGGLIGYLAKTMVDECQQGGPIKDWPPYMKRKHLVLHDLEDAKVSSDNAGVTQDKDPDQPEH